MDAGAEAPRPKLRAVSAVRCGECHEVAEATWRQSAHARAATSPLFLAMMREAGPDAACNRCHAPLKAEVGDEHPVAREGVTCDVCHTVRAAEPVRSGAGVRLQLADNVKYGPLCDAKDHYFHKMGCSPLHQQASLCGSCHLMYLTTDAGTELPIYTEYEEWQTTAFGESDSACQTCHMEGKPGEVAVGAGERHTVHPHGLLGDGGALRKKALSLSLKVRAEGQKRWVDATVENREAGHKVPTGVPGRRVVLEVQALDARGATVTQWRREYARILVDETGVEVPYFRATREESDNRLAPDEPRTESFLVDSPVAARVEAKLWWWETSAELASALGTGAPAKELLVTGTVSFGPGSIEVQR